MKNIVSFHLFEKNIFDLEFKEIANSMFIKLQAQKGALNPYVSQYMWEEFNTHFDPDDDASDIIDTAEFKEWLQYELEHRFNKVQGSFISLIDNENIELFRAISVKDDYLDKLKAGQVKRVGIYWTYEEDKAETHWGFNDDSKPNIVTFSTRVDQKHVDWNNTIRLNLEHEYLNDESELRLFKNTPLLIHKVLWNDEEVELDHPIKCLS